MTLPVPERIAAVIVSRLKAITTANGYTFDITAVDRPNKNANNWRPRHLAAMVDQRATVENDEQTRPGNPPAIGYDTTYHLHAITLPSDYGTDPTATDVNEFVTAIKKAVVGNDNNWGQFGGLSLFAEWGTVQPYLSEDGDNQGAVVPIVVTYRVNERDPFEVRS